MNKFTNIACSTIKAVASSDLSISNDFSNNNEKKLEDLFNEKEQEPTQNKETGQNQEKNQTDKIIKKEQNI